MSVKYDLNKYRKKVKNIEYRRIPISKYERNDPKEKLYWKECIEEFERTTKEKLKKERSKKLNLSTTLPAVLSKRISKIIPTIPIEEDIFDDEFKLAEEDDEDIAVSAEIELSSQPSANESNITVMIQKEHKYKKLDMRISPRPDIRREEAKKLNWFTDYKDKPTKDRVKWQSKLYNLEKNHREKPLLEQAEDIMDVAATEFANRLNELATDDKSKVTKDLIRDLFRLEVLDDIATGIHIEPKIIRALPHKLATAWHVPKLSLDTKVEQHIRDKLAKRAIKPIKVAFGRTLPANMQEWVSTDTEKQLQPVFPEELRTNEVIFKGIGHLRSTKALVEHYKKNENLIRPKYLEDAGAFKTQKKESQDQLPFYQQVINAGRVN